MTQTTLPVLTGHIADKFDLGWNFTPRGPSSRRNKWQACLFRKCCMGVHSFAASKACDENPQSALNKAIAALNVREEK